MGCYLSHWHCTLHWRIDTIFSCTSDLRAFGADSLLVLLLHAEEDANSKHPHDEGQGYDGIDLEASNLCGKLDSDEAQDNCNRLLQVYQVLRGYGQDLIEAAKAQDGRDVGGVYD